MLFYSYFKTLVGKEVGADGGRMLYLAAGRRCRDGVVPQHAVADAAGGGVSHAVFLQSLTAPSLLLLPPPGDGGAEE